MKENKSLEFKLDITNTFLKTVSAFANFNDGEILFGVDDDGKYCGINNPEKACLDIENRINDSISPKPDFDLSIEDNIVRLYVHKGNYIPYMYKGKAYRRSDTASIEVDQFELRELVLDASNMYFEELSCGTKTLSFNILEQKMQKYMSIEILSNDVLKTLGFVAKDGNYNNAAAIFADENEFYGVDIARFGSSISEIMERETVTRVSVLKQYDKAVELYKRYYQYEEISEMERKSIEMIPEAAFREAIANALVHRNWAMNMHVRIAMFKDYIEITSPGGLPKGITKEEYIHGEISCLRNPIVGNVFFRLHYIEMFGTGVRRILESYKDATAKPEFNISDNVISVKLPVLSTNYEVTADERKIIDALKNGSQLASSELVKLTGFSKAKTIRLVNALMEKGYVNCKGKGRGTKYYVR